MAISSAAALESRRRFGDAFAMSRKTPPNRLKEWRKAARLTQAELAERCGTTDQSISRYEAGTRTMTVDILSQLAPSRARRAPPAADPGRRDGRASRPEPQGFALSARNRGAMTHHFG
jgi:transcriptional regulator with XRE-family HTH domain